MRTSGRSAALTGRAASLASPLGHGRGLSGAIKSSFRGEYSKYCWVMSGSEAPISRFFSEWSQCWWAPMYRYRQYGLRAPLVEQLHRYILLRPLEYVWVLGCSPQVTECWTVLWASFRVTRHILSHNHYLQRWLPDSYHHQGWRVLWLLWLDYQLAVRGFNSFYRSRWPFMWRCWGWRSQWACGPYGQRQRQPVNWATSPCQWGRGGRVVNSRTSRWKTTWLVT